MRGRSDRVLDKIIGTRVSSSSSGCCGWELVGTEVVYSRLFLNFLFYLFERQKQKYLLDTGSLPNTAARVQTGQSQESQTQVASPM